MKLSAFIILSIFAGISSAQLPEVYLRFFGANNTDRLIFKYNTFTASDFQNLAVAPYFDPAKKTAIYISGLLERADDAKTLNLVDAYLTRRSEYNIAQMVWSNYSVNFNVIQVVNNIKGVSLSAISILRTCFQGGLNIRATHIVGFSFGSIIASEIGRANTNPQFPRISGIDPATRNGLAILYAANDLRTIDQRAAEYVDTMHTDVVAFGCGSCNGHTAFYANNGIWQPGCATIDGSITSQILFDPIALGNYFNIACTHNRAPTYWANTVRGTINSPYVANRCTEPRSILGIQYDVDGTNCNATMGLFSDVTTTNRDDTKEFKYYVTI